MLIYTKEKANTATGLQQHSTATVVEDEKLEKKHPEPAGAGWSQLTVQLTGRVWFLK
jgi:hypothetical protein